MKWDASCEGHVISEGIYVPEALGWPFDPSSVFSPRM